MVCCFCGKARVRKVYPEYGNIVACETCIRERTISHYRLKTEFFVDLSLLNDVPYITKRFWARYVEEYTLKFYWIEAVQQKLQIDDLSQYRDRKIAEREAEQRVYEAAKKEHIVNLKKFIKSRGVLITIAQKTDVWKKTVDNVRAFSENDLERFLDNVKREIDVIQRKKEKERLLVEFDPTLRYELLGELDSYTVDVATFSDMLVATKAKHHIEQRVKELWKVPYSQFISKISKNYF
jgi:hypothetical protein